VRCTRPTTGFPLGQRCDGMSRWVSRVPCWSNWKKKGKIPGVCRKSQISWNEFSRRPLLAPVRESVKYCTCTTAVLGVWAELFQLLDKPPQLPGNKTFQQLPGLPTNCTCTVVVGNETLHGIWGPQVTYSTSGLLTLWHPPLPVQRPLPPTQLASVSLLPLPLLLSMTTAVISALRLIQLRCSFPGLWILHCTLLLRSYPRFVTIH